jgi:cellulose biosynthesis protein BcsQ
MVKRIALFNHKGGVSKTTTAFNLGWMLASKGKSVILVDADPQCNLSGMVLGYTGPTEFEQFYQRHPGDNLRAGLAPAFESRPEPIKAVNCVPVKGRDGLLLLPGHIRLSEWEVVLGIAQELSGSIQTLQNLPGSISALLQKTADKFNAEYVIVDMSPSLSAINQNLLMTSDFFIVPTSPDYFSVMAIDSLTTVLPNWREWSKKAQSLEILGSAVYPFPNISPKFLGTVVQKYRLMRGGPSAAFQTWIEEIHREVSEKLIPALQSADMMLPDQAYANQHVDHHCLASISDFNSLIALSQENQTPVFALTASQIGHTGVVLGQTEKARDQFLAVFEDLADKVIGLTDHASGA